MYMLFYNVLQYDNIIINYFQFLYVGTYIIFPEEILLIRTYIKLYYDYLVLFKL